MPDLTDEEFRFMVRETLKVWEDHMVQHHCMPMVGIGCGWDDATAKSIVCMPDSIDDSMADLFVRSVVSKLAELRVRNN